MERWPKVGTDRWGEPTRHRRCGVRRGEAHRVHEILLVVADDDTVPSDNRRTGRELASHPKAACRVRSGDGLLQLRPSRRGAGRSRMLRTPR